MTRGVSHPTLSASNERAERGGRLDGGWGSGEDRGASHQEREIDQGSGGRARATGRQRQRRGLRAPRATPTRQRRGTLPESTGHDWDVAPLRVSISGGHTGGERRTALPAPLARMELAAAADRALLNVPLLDHDRLGLGLCVGRADAIGRGGALGKARAGVAPIRQPSRSACSRRCVGPPAPPHAWNVWKGVAGGGAAARAEKSMGRASSDDRSEVRCQLGP